MANSHRGEISAQFNGQDYSLCLTLGALAQLEDIFQASDMLSVAERFASGRISASDCITIIGIGLRAAGHDITDDTVAEFQTENGAAGYVQVVAALLEATFGAEKSEQALVDEEKGQQQTNDLSNAPLPDRTVKKNNFQARKS